MATLSTFDIRMLACGEKKCYLCSVHSHIIYMLYQLLVRVCQLVHSIDEGRDLATIDWKLETNNFDDSTVRHIVKQIWDDTTAARVGDHIKAAAKMWCSPLQAAAVNAAVDWELQNRHFLDEVDDDIATWPVGAPSIPHEQPETATTAPQPAPTRRQGAPKKQLFPSEETLDAKRAEFLREYNHRFPGRQKTITTTVKEDTFNRFVIDMALTWGDEFPALQKGMGNAWEHFLASMDFTWELRSKTWRDKIHERIQYAWKKKKQRQNKPNKT